MILACGLCGGTLEIGAAVAITSAAWIATDIYNRVRLCQTVRANGARQAARHFADGMHTGDRTNSTGDSDCDILPGSKG